MVIFDAESVPFEEPLDCRTRTTRLRARDFLIEQNWAGAKQRHWREKRDTVVILQTCCRGKTSQEHGSGFAIFRSPKGLSYTSNKNNWAIYTANKKED